MGVRADREGVMKVDYHTAGAGYGVPDPSGGGRRTVLSNRYYLADADFLVGLEGDAELLGTLNAALARPRWQLFLGRKAFVPAAPVYLPDSAPWGPGLRTGELEGELAGYPWLGAFDAPRRLEPPDQLRLVLDASAGDATDVRGDVPVSFAERRFASRFVRIDYVQRPAMEKEI
jgi:CRISPR system Cascade subunit CasD